MKSQTVLINSIKLLDNEENAVLMCERWGGGLGDNWSLKRFQIVHFGDNFSFNNSWTFGNDDQHDILINWNLQTSKMCI